MRRVHRAPATQSRYLPSSPWYSKPAATRYTFDLTKAKALLQQAGHPDGFTTTLSIGDATIPGSKAMAQIWSQDLATIGVKLTILEKEHGPFFDDYFKGNYDVIGWLLDRWLGTGPWLLVAGIVLGAAAGFYEFIRITSKLT